MEAMSLLSTEGFASVFCYSVFICLLVCFAARLCKKLQVDLVEIVRVGWAWSKVNVIRFGWWSRSASGSGNFFEEFFYLVEVCALWFWGEFNFRHPVGLQTAQLVFASVRSFQIISTSGRKWGKELPLKKWWNTHSTFTPHYSHAPQFNARNALRCVSNRIALRSRWCWAAWMWPVSESRPNV